MPKQGMQPLRRRALVQAAIAAVGARGPDVTVAEIARDAGMSPALAHHYFDGKTDMFDHAMRHILSEYGRAVRAELARGGDRVEAIVRASFAPGNFAPGVAGAWLAFYAQSRKSPVAGRLLAIYQRRLHANLVHALRLRGHPDPRGAAQTLAALIDGVYLRAALSGHTDGAAACRSVMEILE